MRLQLEGITKQFGTFTANDDISLTVDGGEVLCLLGENGAGKSTLMNIVYGLITPTSGEISIDGQVLRLTSPRDARRAGIGMVHQHFMLVPAFTVAENVMLGDEKTRAGFLDLEAARRKVRDLAERFGFDLDPDAVVGDLSVGVQQRVEIIKAISHEASFLVFDEPTAVLTPQETDELLRVIHQLRDEGTGIIFISHKLREVRAIADRIAVIRRGRIVGSADSSASASELASLMVGRPVDLTVRKEAPALTSRSFDLRAVTVRNSDQVPVLSEITFSVAGGEVLGIAGVQGNGQTELVETILGIHQPVSGTIALNGDTLTGRTVRGVLDAGVAVVPEDRQTDGLVGEFSIAENMMLDRHAGKPFVRRGTIDAVALRERATGALREFDIRAPHVDTPVARLSGGNAQKVVLARELDRGPELFIAAQPTRGLDVGSIEFVHDRIIATRDSGIPVIVISTELEEIIGLSDRIAVMFAGRIVGIVPATTPVEILGRMMAGDIAEEDAA